VICLVSVTAPAMPAAGANDPKRPVGFGYAYATGWVAASLSRLTVRFQGGGASDIPLHGRDYL
jgi:hypothetical protein